MYAYPRRTRAVLLTLLLLVVTLFLLREWWPPPVVAPLTSRAAADLRAEITAAAVRNERPAPEAFAFDPNLVATAELRRLGLSEKQAASWLKFRGQRRDAFRKPEDIGKLFVLSEDDKARLIPLAYISAGSSMTQPEQRQNRVAPESFAFDPNTISSRDLQRLGLISKQAAAWLKFRGNRPRAFREAEDIRRLFVLSEADKDRLVALATVTATPERREEVVVERQRFRFDPNTISPDSLQLLGFPGWQAEAFARYRGERRSTFRRATDLRRVGALDSALVEAVIDLVDIVPVTEKAEGPGEETAVPSTYAYRPKAPLPAPASIDINKADTSLLKSLPCIGSYRAQRILRFRRALGGFYSVAQLAETRGLPDSTFQQIQEYLLYRTPPRQIALNQATFEELNRHPYINRNLANSMVRNREKAGRFAGPEDLRRLRLVTEEVYGRIVGYLSFE